MRKEFNIAIGLIGRLRHIGRMDLFYQKIKTKEKDRLRQSGLLCAYVCRPPGGYDVAGLPRAVS